FDLFVKDVDSRLGGASGTLPADKDQLWAEASKRYEASNWVAARVAYLQFARQNKDDQRTDNAYYQIGETYLNQGRYADAIVEFRRVVAFPRSDVADAAIYRSADALAAMGRCENAKALYESFVAEYPRSKFRRKAYQKIRAIKKTGTCK
ncbi:MAG: tetratricopeptide repeat protein, partial [Myxococcota bacterium]